jgi:hypothetical protein
VCEDRNPGESPSEPGALVPDRGWVARVGWLGGVRAAARGTAARPHDQTAGRRASVARRDPPRRPRIVPRNRSRKSSVPVPAGGRHQRNGWSASTEIGGRHRLKPVVGFDRNRWSASPKYAPRRRRRK